MIAAARVGQRIAAARKARGWTQQFLADMALVSKGMLSKVEAGHAVPSARWVGRVADALRVDAGRLTGLEPPDVCWACGRPAAGRRRGAPERPAVVVEADTP